VLDLEWRTGAIMAALYLFPFLLLAGLPPSDFSDIGAIFIWFVYFIVAFIILVIEAIIAHVWLDISFVPWGLALVFGSLLLTVVLSPVFTLLGGLWIVPPIVAFLIGATQG